MGFTMGAEGQSGVVLERTLHSLIDNHRVFTYSEARDILKTLDLAPGRLPVLRDGNVIYGESLEAEALEISPESSGSLELESWTRGLAGGASEITDGVRVWTIPVGESDGRR